MAPSHSCLSANRVPKLGSLRDSIPRRKVRISCAEGIGLSAVARGPGSLVFPSSTQREGLPSTSVGRESVLSRWFVFPIGKCRT